MGRHTFFVLLALTVIWVILMEEISWRAVAMGMLTTMLCMHVGGKFLPYEEIKDVNFFKLVTFPFFLIGQIYIAGFFMIGLLIKGPVVDVVTFKTKLENDALRTMLADCITLTPGSILLELKEGMITLLWIRYKDTPGDTATAEAMLKDKLEQRLIRAEIKPDQKDE